MTQLEPTIDIDVSRERVWEILTDFAAYPLWNPFITEISGALEVGAVLKVHLALPAKPPMSFKPTLKVVDRPRELRWAGQVLAPGLFDGEHGFEIEALDAGRCRLRHVEVFSGVLVPLFIPALQDVTRAGFEAMNRALKARAEAAG